MNNDISRKLPEKNKNSSLVTREPRPLKEVPEQYNTSKQNICQPELVKHEKRRLFSENQLKIRIQTDDPLNHSAQGTKKEILQSPL